MSRRIITFKKTGYTDVRAWKRSNERYEKSIREGVNGKVGHVYIFRLYDGYYKIGKTYSIEKRMKTLRASCPTLSCIWSAYVRDMNIVEKELHKFFKKKKVEREVFMLQPGDDVQQADRIADKYR